MKAAQETPTESHRVCRKAKNPDAPATAYFPSAALAPTKIVLAPKSIANARSGLSKAALACPALFSAAYWSRGIKTPRLALSARNFASCGPAQTIVLLALPAILKDGPESPKRSGTMSPSGGE